MGRPRQHDLDGLLAHARRLWVGDGVDAVTMRALTAASGASNGAIYHAFGSRDGLLARVWAREADTFLAFQREEVERAGDPTAAVLAAALAPARYADRDQDAARLLLATTADRLMTPELDDDGRELLHRLRHDLGTLLAGLADALWGRRDRSAVTMVRYCVVDLPGALLLQGSDLSDPVAHHALEHAVRGIVAQPPPRS
ncbi:MAG: TetR family transcriptional regulator [Nocardioides sp.]|nr:TetR family transcriptional regulator [Nocardioides sp.]